MTINIIVTEAAIDGLAEATGADRETCEETIRNILNLCILEASPEAAKNEREDSLDRILTDGIRTLGIHGVEYWRHKDLSGAIEDLVRKLSSKKNPATLVEALEKIGSRTPDAKPPFRVLSADLMASTARTALSKWRSLSEIEKGELVEAARDVIAYFDLFEGSTFAFLAANNPAFLVRIGRLRRALDGEKIPDMRPYRILLERARELCEEWERGVEVPDVIQDNKLDRLFRDLSAAVYAIMSGKKPEKGIPDPRLQKA